MASRLYDAGRAAASSVRLRDNERMAFLSRNASESKPLPRWLHVAFVIAALAYAAPLAWNAYERVLRVIEQARTRLIQQHRLWEGEIGFRGRPEVWTRMAAHLLTDQQLMRRLSIKYGGQAQEHEIEYRRDVLMARAEVVVSALALWGAPLAALYVLVWIVRRRKPTPPPKTQPASVNDPRYLPPS